MHLEELIQDPVVLDSSRVRVRLSIFDERASIEHRRKQAFQFRHFLEVDGHVGFPDAWLEKKVITWPDGSRTVNIS